MRDARSALRARRGRCGGRGMSACSACVLPFVWIDPHRTAGIQPFGFFVVLAIIAGELLMRGRARRVGLSDREMRTLFWWCLLLGLLVSHVLDEIFYHPEQIALRPWSLLFVWEGLSSMGGFVGAALAAALWKHWQLDGGRPRRRDAPIAVLPYADVVLATFPVSWAIARVGCTVVHDHPGSITQASTFLSVGYPSGAGDVVQPIVGPIVFIWGREPRYDLGLIEMLFSFLLAGAIAATWRKRLPLGTYVAIVPLAYAPVRFALDFLRATDLQGSDLRHASLTFAQWACLALFAYGVAMTIYVWRSRSRARPAANSGEGEGEVARAMQSRSTPASASTSGGSSIER
jgi:phosphatidylglycerol:prolipoprotein diacylglycerol transferase